MWKEYHSHTAILTVDILKNENIIYRPLFSHFIILNDVTSHLFAKHTRFGPHIIFSWICQKIRRFRTRYVCSILLCMAKFRLEYLYVLFRHSSEYEPFMLLLLLLVWFLIYINFVVLAIQIQSAIYAVFFFGFSMVMVLVTVKNFYK